jgi:hypothetical protein
MTPARRNGLVAAIGASIGLLLFTWAVQRVGVTALLDAVGRVGWGLAAIFAIGGLRFVLRSQCWRWCLPRGVRLDYPHAFSAFLAGDAVGNVTPLGLLASEPTKVLLTRHHLATMDSLASLTLENILYTFSVMAMLAFGLSLMLVMVPLPAAVQGSALAGLLAIGVIAITAFTILRAPVDATGHSRVSWRGRLVRLRGELSRFAVERPARLAQVFLLHVCFHVLAVLETFLTLEWLLGEQSPTAVQAILFETVNRLTIVLFKFVPFRIGIDEATSGAAASLFAVTAAAGVALALIRKARVLFWSAIGLLLLVMHPASPAGGTVRTT